MTLVPATVTITSTLSAQTITPFTAEAGTTVNMTITGSGFSPGAVVSFEGGLGVASQVASVQYVNSTTLVATVNVMADGSFGTQTWDLRVTNPNSTTILLLDVFTVIP
jgi:hypothetical protein